jgi:hypothetical protein
MAFLFAALYVAGNGVMTIVRGTVPAELYGCDRYGTAVATKRPRLLSSSMAVIVDNAGPPASVASKRLHLKLLEVLPLWLGQFARLERGMRSWKVLLGVGGACAACCALPLVGGTAALAASSSAALVFADALLPAAGVVAALAVGAGVWWLRRRAAQRSAACGCTPAASGLGDSHASH